MRFITIGCLVIGLVISLNLWKNDSLYLPKPDPWPTVEGKVLESSLKLVSEDAEAGTSIFNPIVKYQFEHRGQMHTESTVFLYNKKFASRSSAMQIINRFQPERKIEVYINPKLNDSRRSVLIWEIPDQLNGLAGIAGLCFAIVIGALVYSFIWYLFERRFNR